MAVGRELQPDGLDELMRPVAPSRWRRRSEAPPPSRATASAAGGARGGRVKAKRACARACAACSAACSACTRFNPLIDVNSATAATSVWSAARHASPARAPPPPPGAERGAPRAPPRSAPPAASRSPLRLGRRRRRRRGAVLLGPCARAAALRARPRLRLGLGLVDGDDLLELADRELGLRRQPLHLVELAAHLRVRLRERRLGALGALHVLESCSFAVTSSRHGIDAVAECAGAFRRRGASPRAVNSSTSASRSSSAAATSEAASARASAARSAAHPPAAAPRAARGRCSAASSASRCTRPRPPTPSVSPPTPRRRPPTRRARADRRCRCSIRHRPADSGRRTRSARHPVEPARCAATGAARVAMSSGREPAGETQFRPKLGEQRRVRRSDKRQSRNFQPPLPASSGPAQRKARPATRREHREKPAPITMIVKK